MAYTAGDLITQVQNRLDDTSFSSTLIRQFLNDAQREITARHRWTFMEASYTGTLTIDQYIYDLPSAIQSVETFRITDPSGEEKDLTRNYIDYRQYDNKFPDPSEDSSGKPKYWTLRDQNYYLHPKPDQAYTLDIRYQKIVTEMDSDSDVPEIPSEFQEILVTGALIRAHKFNDDYDISQLEERKLDELILNMQRRYNARQTGVPNRMRNSWRRTSLGSR